MNSIVRLHHGASSTMVCPRELVLNRLGVWLDDEQETLGRIFAQTGQRGAQMALDDLAQLHLDPVKGSAGLREMLEDAQALLSVLQTAIADMPKQPH